MDCAQIIGWVLLLVAGVLLFMNKDFRSAGAAAATTTDGLLMINSAKALDASNDGLVLVVADYCGHCQNAKKTIAADADMRSKVMVCEATPELFKIDGLTGVPGLVHKQKVVALGAGNKLYERIAGAQKVSASVHNKYK